MLCGAVHEMLKPINRFSAIVLGLVVAAVFWVLQMFLAWALYAFAELVEYTKATHKELSDMSDPYYTRRGVGLKSCCTIIIIPGLPRKRSGNVSCGNY